jgi:uncharacterized protein YndB with AHSA1/START domain
MSFDLSINRHVAAPPEKVWEVMTGRLTEWWCPKPWATIIEQLEWKDGGTFHLTMRGPNGEADCQGEESIPGVLLEFTPGKRFVFTDALGPGWKPRAPFMVGLFEIEPDGAGTRYRATARHWTAEDMEKHREMGFEGGWTAVADQLAALCESVDA